MTRKYSPEQQDAIDCDHPNQLVIAGPGSGKTTTVVGRINRLLETTNEPIVVMTFTNAAAKELQERIQEPKRLNYIGTLHGYALRELKRHGWKIGYGHNITILDEEQAEALMVETAKAMGSKAQTKRLWKMRQEWTGLRASTQEELVVKSYLRKLRMASAVDFDSLLNDFLELITLHPTGLIGHLIVDEYQDSGDKDAEIYRTIAARNRFYVGDPDQAIYGFRGGRVEHILNYAAADTVHVHNLEGNYRCAPAICGAANNLIAHNQIRYPKLTVPAKPWEHNGEVLLRPALGIDDAERTRVLENVQRLIGIGENPNEIAILARGNALVREFSAGAEAMGIEIRKKEEIRVPKDWSAARAAVELLNAPQSTVTARQWLRARHGAAREQELAHKAAIQQTTLSRLITEPITPVTEAADLPTALARMGISQESIELMKAKIADLPEWDISALSFAMARDLEHRQETGHGVTITTIHAAKGREWETVYMVGCEQELMPGTRVNADVDEERRIAFVGITRAKKRLVLSAASKRRVTWGNKMHEPSTPSQFLAEVEGQP